MKKIKSPIKGLKNAHSSNDKTPMGEYSGFAIKNKMGRVRDSYMDDGFSSKSKKIGKPPKSLA